MPNKKLEQICWQVISQAKRFVEPTAAKQRRRREIGLYKNEHASNEIHARRSESTSPSGPVVKMWKMAIYIFFRSLGTDWKCGNLQNSDRDGHRACIYNIDETTQLEADIAVFIIPHSYGKCIAIELRYRKLRSDARDKTWRRCTVIS